ncbi:MAG: sulfotransferase family protein [Acidimicrobiales bacterium]
MLGEPTFLVGAEQSGTTLLRLMLDSHPEIAFAEEFEYAVEPIASDGSFPAITDYQSYLAGNRSFSTSGFTVDPTLSFPELINGFLQSRRQQKDAEAVGATLHHGFSKALTLWPNAKFIHLVRDPRDVAPARMSEGLAGNVWHGLDAWIETEDEWAQVEAQVDPSRILNVRFSELITSYHNVLDEICRFIGVDYTAQMLDYASDTDYAEPSMSVAGDWRDLLSARDVSLIEARVGDRLTRLGYEPSGTAPAPVSEQQLSWLRWQDRYGRIGGRVQNYGMRLTVAEMLVRGLKSQPLQRSIQLRLNEAEKAQRKKSWSENAKYRTSQ